MSGGCQIGLRPRWKNKQVPWVFTYFALMMTGTGAKGIGRIYFFGEKQVPYWQNWGLGKSIQIDVKMRNMQFPREMIIFLCQDVSILKIGKNGIQWGGILW